MLYIDVRPADRRGMFTATLAGRVLCTSRQPLLDAARALLEEGASPDDMLVMRRENGTISLRSRIGVAAGLTVTENCRDGVPRFRSYRAHGLAVAPPMRSFTGAGLVACSSL
jgi:hypothetical protein